MTKKRKLILACGAVLSVLAVMFLFFTNPTAHLAHAGGGLAMATSAAAMPETEFQGKILKGVESLTGDMAKFKTDQQKILDDYGRTDTAVKKAAEDLQKVMDTCNEQALVIARLKSLVNAVNQNARSSFGDPVERAMKNEEMRSFFNAVGRVQAARMLGEKPDSAYEKLLEKGSMFIRSLTGVDAGLGQATVPQLTFNEIYDTLLQYGKWGTLGVMRVGMRTVVVPLATARPQFYWIGSGSGQGETSAITAGNFTGTSVTGIIQTLAAYITVSRELLADSTVDLAPYIMKEMNQSIAQGLDTAAFIGAGTTDQTNAGYFGIFQAAQVNVNCAATTAQGNITVGSTQLNDWLQVPLTVSPEVLNRSPRWWMHPQMMVRALGVTDKNGRPLFQSWVERPDVPGFMSVLGYPVEMTGIAPNTDGPGNLVAAFGDPQGQAVMIRSDLELATSDDINFAQNMRAFRALMRAGVKLKTTTNSNSLVPFAVLTLSAS